MRDVRRLERRTVSARTVTIKVRYADFTTITRSLTEPPPARDGKTVAARALSLLGQTEAGVRPVRLLGVSVHNLFEGDSSSSSPPADGPLLWDLPTGPTAS